MSFNALEWLDGFLQLNRLEKTDVMAIIVPKYHHISKKLVPFEGLTMIYVDGEGGSEGDGQYMDATFAVAPEGSQLISARNSVNTVKEAVTYLCTTGTYNSWDASEWDGEWSEVEPKQVTRTEFAHK